MAYRNKIDQLKLLDLKRQGYSLQRMAKYFNCSGAAICKAQRKLSVSVAKSTALEVAHVITSENIDSLKELNKMNAIANEMLGEINAALKGDPEAVAAVERQNAIKGNIKIIDLREMSIRLMGEIRRQLDLQRNLFQTLCDYQAIQRFQMEVISIITSEVDDETKKRIIDRLKNNRLLRQSVRFTQ